MGVNFSLAGFLLLTALTWGQTDESGPADRHFTGRVQPIQVCMNKRTLHRQVRYLGTHNGKTYHFCCNACLTKFNANPTQERWGIDPVNGNSVDKSEALLYAYKGRVFFLESERTLKKFSKKPTKYRQHGI